MQHEQNIENITTINTLKINLLKEGGRKKQGLSAKTVSDILTVLKSTYRFGREKGYPCIPLDSLHMPQKITKPIRTIDYHQLHIIEKKLKYSNDLLSLGILFTLYTGVRIGELCGLRWADIDLNSKTVTIRRSIERIATLSSSGAKTKVVINEPKTSNSVRIIPLPSFLAERLTFFRQDQNRYFMTGTQKHTEPHQVYMRYKTWMKKLGFSQYSFHDLRHTFATRCIEAGFDTKSLSEILGHANITTTLSIYTHPSLDHKRKQMERLTSLYS